MDGAQLQNGFELVIYDAADDSPPEVVGDAWPNTDRSLRILKEIVRRFNATEAADAESTLVAAIEKRPPASELVVVIYDAADDESELQEASDHWPDTPRSRRILGEMARQANVIMAADPDPDSTFVAAVATCDPSDEPKCKSARRSA